MPMLRWFGFSRVTSFPPTEIAPAEGCSKPATMRRTVVLPQPDGPRNETNSPVETSRLKSWTTVVVPKDFRRFWMLRKVSAMAVSDQFGWLADFGANRASTWMTDMQPQVMMKAMMASAAGS